MPKFTVWGYVVAERLPEGTLRLGEATIRKEPDSSRLYPPAQRSHSSPIHAADHFYAAFSPFELHIDSRWTIGFENVEAVDAHEAFEDVNRTRVPRVLAALEAVTGAPAFISMVGIEDFSTDPPTTVAPWSRTLFTRTYAASPFLPSDAGELQSISGAMEIDQAGQVAARLLASASTMAASFGGEAYLRAAALFEIVKGMETIVFAVCKEAPKVDDLYAKQEAVIERLRRELAKRKTPKRAAATVNAANRELQSLKGQTTKDRVRRAGDLLGIDHGDVNALVALWDFRSRSLGHGGEIPTVEDKQIDEAFALARRVMRAYLAWLVAGAKP